MIPATTHPHLNYIEHGEGWDTRLDSQSAAPIPWEFDFCDLPLLLTCLYTYYPEVATEPVEGRHLQSFRYSAP